MVGTISTTTTATVFIELKYIKSLISLFLVDIIFDYTVPAFHACSLIFLFAFTVEDTQATGLNPVSFQLSLKIHCFQHLVISKFVSIILAS